jgi:hypothetical protein
MRSFKTISDLDDADIHDFYRRFNSPISSLDCGKKCSVHNSSGKAFCCDICHAVPAAYEREWSYVASRTDLWHAWRGDECSQADESSASLQSETPREMILLACLGPSKCQREFRVLSCRQFPFFPYVTSDYCFLGLAYEWEFETKCWVLSNLSQVTETYRAEFIRFHDRLFALFQEQFDNYAYYSERMRAEYMKRKRRFPLLHRNGKNYLVSPGNERLTRIDLRRLPHFGFYK